MDLSLDIDELQRQLAVACERRERASQALAPHHQGGEWEEFYSADGEVLRLERALAAARNDEYAEPCEFPVKWDSGTPLPHLLANELRAFLAFVVRDPAAPPRGVQHILRGDNGDTTRELALVTFNLYASVRLGTPNDEVHAGHPLGGKGLEAYTAQRVINSRWIRELEQINSVHSQFAPESWRKLQHYIFWFHDSTFECVAPSFTVERHRVSMRDLLVLMADRLVS